MEIDFNTLKEEIIESSSVSLSEKLGVSKKIVNTTSLDADKVIVSLRDLLMLLDEAEIRYEVSALFGGVVIVFPDYPSDRADVILHESSYGRENYNWESMGMHEDADGVTGNLTSKEVVLRLKRAIKGINHV